MVLTQTAYTASQYCQLDDRGQSNATAHCACAYVDSAYVDSDAGKLHA